MNGAHVPRLNAILLCGLSNRPGSIAHPSGGGMPFSPDILVCRNRDCIILCPTAYCVSDHSRGQDFAPATALRTNDNSPPTKPKNALILSGKNIIVIPDIISRKRKENIRNLRRKADMPPHWRECEAPLRRTQRDGADETIPGGCFPSRLSPRRMSGTTVGRILSHPLERLHEEF